MTSKVSLMSIHDCLSSKIDPNIMNKANANNRAIHYAARRGNVNFGRMLLRARADVNCRNSLGMTPLMVASAGKFSMHTNFVRFMIDNGAKVDDKDRAGSTALVHAVMNINVNNVAVLLHHNATVVEPVHEMMSLEVPEALTIGKFLRARDENVNSEPGMSDEYFALMKISGPSIIDRVCSLGICRPSNIVVDMLEMAHEKKFLNYYEISKENYANLFWHLLHHLHLKRIKTTKEVVKKKRKVLQIQKLDDSVRTEAIAARKAARKLKKELAAKAVDDHNLDAARQELLAVTSKSRTEQMYNTRQSGSWQQVKNKPGRKKTNYELRQEEGKRSEVKQKWKFQEVTADKSLGVKFDPIKMIGKADWETNLETAEEKADLAKMSKLASKLKKMEQSPRADGFPREIIVKPQYVKKTNAKVRRQIT
ncbi:hypothetical protein ScalyP_jg12107 [Parmales sp. scaly parma]|nr:hypothetical protein ScalyP_jg12107 [Parmales sp. scaly parma]